MFEFYEKRKIKRLVYSRPVVLLMCIPVFFLGSTAWSAYEKEQNTHSNMLASRAELDRLKEREQALSSELTRLDTERGVEQEIRSKYEMGKEGEHMIVLVDKSDKQERSAPPIEEKSFFGKIWEKIGW